MPHGQNKKHHNTVEFLICVAPNSGITFISIAYNGRLSDKKIKLERVVFFIIFHNSQQ